MAGRIDLAQPVAQMGAAAIGGGVQRVGWETGNAVGFMTTGGLALGGLLMSFFTNPGSLTNSIAKGFADSGASTIGWVVTERFMVPQLMGTPRFRIPARRYAGSLNRGVAASAAVPTGQGTILFSNN